MNTHDLQALIELSEKATAGVLELHTSNSWRRIVSRTERAGAIIRPWLVPSTDKDGHANMDSEDNAAFVVALVNWFRTQAPTLAAGEGFSASDMMDARRDERERIALHAAEAELGELRRRVVDLCVKWDGECSGFLSRANADDKDYMQEGIYKAAESTLRIATTELRAALGCATTGEMK